MVIKGTQVTKGMVVVYKGEPCKVIKLRYTMSGRGGNSISTTLRNILTGTQAEHRYKSDDKVEKAFIENRDFEYLYADGEEHCFMDCENYEQFTLNQDEVEDVLGYLLPNSKCQLQIYDGKAIGVVPPLTVELKIVETEPSLKGATASGNVTKPATLETGLLVQVPMFVENGETVVINSETNEYQGRKK
jgi:elongation factor P